MKIHKSKVDVTRSTIWTTLLILGLLGSGCKDTSPPPADQSSSPTFQNEIVNAVSNEPRKVDNKTRLNPEGWPIPDAARFIKKSKRREKVGGRVLDTFEYSPASDVVYDARRDWAPSEETEHWLLGKMVKFESRGKALAYYFTGYKVTLNDDYTVQDRIATAVGIVISDTNSDGTFESLDFVAADPRAAFSKIPLTSY